MPIRLGQQACSSLFRKRIPIVKRAWLTVDTCLKARLSIPKKNVVNKKYQLVHRSFIHSSTMRLKGAVVSFNLADIGEGITECEVIQWFVEPGAVIQQFDKICEVQSDKATVEITSRYDGKVVKLHYKAGEVAKVGSPLVDIATEGEEEASTAAPAKAASAAPPKVVAADESVRAVASVEVERTADSIYILATPAVRRIAKEQKVNLEHIKATGKGGRITKEDIIRHVEGAAQSAAPKAQAQQEKIASVPGAPKIVPLTPIQKAMVKSMKTSLAIPHFGFSDTVNFGSLKRLRADINHHLASASSSKAHKVKLSYMPFLIKSFSLALQDFPLLNSQFVETANPPHILYRPDHNIGIAVDTPHGLTVPTLHGVQNLSILEINQKLQELADKAKKNQLAPSAFQHTTITISNIGNLGGGVLSPVIPPETVCIAAIGRSKEETKLIRNERSERGYDVVQEETTMISFSADHRVVDGASVARFFLAWRSLIENPGRMTLWLK